MEVRDDVGEADDCSARDFVDPLADPVKTDQAGCAGQVPLLRQLDAPFARGG